MPYRQDGIGHHRIQSDFFCLAVLDGITVINGTPIILAK